MGWGLVFKKRTQLWVILKYEFRADENKKRDFRITLAGLLVDFEKRKSFGGNQKII